MGKRAIIISLILYLVLLILFAEPVVAKSAVNSEKSNFFLQTSLITRHWSNNEEHNNLQELIGLEYQQSNSNLYGLAGFKNSACQLSWYLYRGQIYNFNQLTNSWFKLYGKLTYGLITGYEEDHSHSSIWYELGTFPAVLPTIGISYKNISLETSLFGNAGVIVHGGIKF